MRRPHRPDSLRPALDGGRRVAAAAVALALVAALGACKGDEPAPASPATAALVASAPAMATSNVPPPPVIRAVAASPSGGSDDLAAVHAKLESTLASATTCSADAECATVATGAKACGGPTAYRAYSTRRADPKSVADLAAHEHDLGMAAARASGEVSACFMLADPGAHCQKSRCVTGPASTN